jgi:hypothetical protein
MMGSIAAALAEPVGERLRCVAHRLMQSSADREARRFVEFQRQHPNARIR